MTTPDRHFHTSSNFQRALRQFPELGSSTIREFAMTVLVLFQGKDWKAIKEDDNKADRRGSVLYFANCLNNIITSTTPLLVGGGNDQNGGFTLYEANSQLALGDRPICFYVFEKDGTRHIRIGTSDIVYSQADLGISLETYVKEVPPTAHDLIARHSTRVLGYVSNTGDVCLELQVMDLPAAL